MTGDLEQLKAELTEALALALHNNWSTVKHFDAAKVDQDCKDDADCVMDDLWLVFSSAVFAACTEERERITDQVEAKLIKLRDAVENPNTEAFDCGARFAYARMVGELPPIRYPDVARGGRRSGRR